MYQIQLVDLLLLFFIHIRVAQEIYHELSCAGTSCAACTLNNMYVLCTSLASMQKIVGNQYTKRCCWSLIYIAPCGNWNRLLSVCISHNQSEHEYLAWNTWSHWPQLMSLYTVQHFATVRTKHDLCLYGNINNALYKRTRCTSHSQLHENKMIRCIIWNYFYFIFFPSRNRSEYSLLRRQPHNGRCHLCDHMRNAIERLCRKSFLTRSRSQNGFQQIRFRYARDGWPPIAPTQIFTNIHK